MRPGSRLLETERKLLTHAIRMSAYNGESALARLLAPHYAHSEHEGRALLREAFTLPGDLQVIGDTLHVRLDPAPAPRRSKALAALCTELNDTRRRHPARPTRPRTSPATQQSPRRTLHRTQRHATTFPRHQPDPELQRQRPPDRT